MTLLAWVSMLSAWSFIVICTGYCFYKLMFSKSLESSE